jgi:predicted lactoylglutathione lyase
MSGLTVVTLGVEDVARARAFYEAWGFKASSASTGDIVFFDAGGPVLALYSRHALAEDAQVKADGSGFRAVSFARNVGSKTEVDDALKLAVKAGAKLLKPAQEVFWGGYSGYVADLDGHTWEVAFNPHWTLSADGRVKLPKV